MLVWKSKQEQQLIDSYMYERKENAHMSKYISLNNLMLWMQAICEKEEMHAQNYGIQPFYKKEIQPLFHVGFLLFREFSGIPDGNKEIYNYHMYGYLEEGDKNIVYKSDLTQTFKHREDVYENTLEIVNNHVVRPEYRRCGIGSAAISRIKELAIELHCTKLFGDRIPVMEKHAVSDDVLKQFYASAGFEQSEGSTKFEIILR